MTFSKKNISVIGLGFVGFPMAIALANIKENKSNKKFNVVGVENNTERGIKICNLISDGKMPIDTDDILLKKKFKNVYRKNFYATTDISNIKKSNYIIVSISFNINKAKDIDNIKTLFRKIGKLYKKNSLILIETTLPPGICDKIIYPEILKETRKRKIKNEDVLLSYSYERVTPGENYYSSLINMTRNYSGVNYKAKKKCKELLLNMLKNEKLINELDSIRDCEAAKILENSYRALNIAFIDEWVKYSFKAKLNLEKIIESIKIRPTHRNIMRPGLGVGGYCLTKDPGFVMYSSKNIIKNKTDFPLTKKLNLINKNMVNTSLEFVADNLELKGAKVLLYGMTYKENVGDFRHSASEILADKLIKKKVNLEIYDPYIRFYENKRIYNISKDIFSNKYDAVLFCVNHLELKNIKKKIFNRKCKYFDLNSIFSFSEQSKLKKQKINFFKLGNN